ncbi:Flagellar hook-associated protein FlgL [hydrothermal vent metagenome]|uniref:Flagellar hook-associated protein FlgL n=1 Tax=hydrothermal vent metagenome TaxID=652676 RepID=A0A3B0YUX1_9ZZZZ
MRISTGQIQLSGLNRMLEQQAQLLRTQQQLSSQKRILTPADDPAASAKIVGLEQSLKVTEQFQVNIDFSRSRLELEEGVIAGIKNTLDRVREIAVQGNSSTLTNADRRTLATEVSQNLSELLGLANSRDAGGEYLFSGYQGHTQPFTATASGPYVYNGDDGQRSIQIGTNRQLAVTDSGTSAFREIRNGNGTFTTLDNQSNTGSGIIDPGSVSDPALIDGDTYTISFYTPSTATGSLTYNDDLTTPDNLDYTLEINGTTVYTTDEADVSPINTLDDLAIEINNASIATGVRAHVDNGALYLTNTAAPATPITITESMGGANDGGLDSMVGYFGSNLDGSGTPSVTTTVEAATEFYLVEDGTGNAEAFGSYTDGGSIGFNGIQTNIKGEPNLGDQFVISPSLNQGVFSTVRNLQDALEGIGSGTAEGSAQLNNAINRFFVDIDRAMDNFNGMRAQIGARMNALDSQQSLNEDSILRIKETVSELEDLDMIEAVTRLRQQEVALQAAQQSFVRIQGLSLFNFL